MLISIESIDHLQEVISADKNIVGEHSVTYNRYPVRFLLFNDFITFKEGIAQLCKNNMELQRIETRLPFEDGWITRLDMWILIQNFVFNSNKDIIVSPFSEIIRFYDDAEFISFFKEVSMIEANPKYLGKRVYLPIIGLEHRLMKFKDSIEGAIIWELLLDTPKQNTIFISKDYNIPLPDDITHIKTSKDWLRLWTGSFPKKQIFCSSSPILNYYKNSQPDTVFNLEPINNEYEFLVKVYKLQSPYSYQECDREYWKKLLLRIQDLKVYNYNLIKFTLNHFNIVQFKPCEFLRLWFAFPNDFSRWLLVRIYDSDNDNSGTYIKSILLALNDFSDNEIISCICLNIFQLDITPPLIKERNDLLKFLKKETIPISENVSDKLQLLLMELLNVDVSTALNLCTDTFDFERKLLCNLFYEGKITSDQLKLACPMINGYLKRMPKHCTIDGQYWIVDYIDSYKKAKIKNNYTTDICQLINTINKDENSFFEWYMSLPTPQSVLAKLSHVHKVYWIDGLGIEWISFIIEIIKFHSHLSLDKCMITRTNIPSITEINKYPDFVKRDELDSFIHNKIYKYPDTILTELEIVKSIIEDILGKIQNQTIAIVSDHGLTALSRLVDSKKYKIGDNHEGRCAIASLKMNKSCCDFIIYKHTETETKYVVALKHASLGDKPKREVHGGCTPEEVLVPVFVISDKSSEYKKIVTEFETKESRVIPQEIGFEEVELF